MAGKNSSSQDDLLVRHNNMVDALHAISEEAHRLLRLCNVNLDLSEGLDLIYSCANYKMDVRSDDETERSRPVKEIIDS
jgi:hypothetical protein